MPEIDPKIVSLLAEHGLVAVTEAQHRVLNAVRTVELASLEYYVSAFGDETGWGAVSAAEIARRNLEAAR